MDGCSLFVGIARGWRRCMVVEHRRPEILWPSQRNGAAGSHGCRTEATLVIQPDAADSGAGYRARRFTNSSRSRGGIS